MKKERLCSWGMMKPFLWLFSLHSWHLFNLLLTRIWLGWDCVYEGGLRPALPIQGVQSLSRVKSKAEWDLNLKESFRFQDDTCLIPLNCHEIGSVARQPKWRALRSFYSGCWTPQTWFYDEVVCCGRFGLKSQALCTPTNGFHLKPVSSTIPESWEDTPWWLVSKTRDGVEVLLHKPTTWRTRLKCAAAGSYRFLEVDGAFWILSFTGCLKKNWPQVD